MVSIGILKNIDFISVTDSDWETSSAETSNYFFTVLNINCDF